MTTSPEDNTPRPASEPTPDEQPNAEQAAPTTSAERDATPATAPATQADAGSQADLDEDDDSPAVPSLEEMMAQAQQLQASMQQAQEQLSAARVEGQADNGAVRALVSGTGELLDLRIAPAVINPNDPQTLIRLILTAVHDAGEKATAMQEQALNAISPDMMSMLGGGED